MNSKTYEEGLRDGRLQALERMTEDHSKRLDSHSRRINMLEKVAWIMLGIVCAIQALPTVQKVIGAG